MDGIPATAEPVIVQPSTRGFIYTRFDSTLYRRLQEETTWKGLPLAPSGELVITADGLLFSDEDGRIFRSEDNGDAWIKVDTLGGDLEAGLDGGLYDVFSNAYSNSGGRGGSVRVSYDGGESWTQIPLPDDHMYEFAVGPDATLFVAGVDVLYYSIDRGATWQRINFNPCGCRACIVPGMWSDIRGALSVVDGCWDVWVTPRPKEVVDRTDFTKLAEIDNSGSISRFRAADQYGSSYSVAESGAVRRTTDYGETWETIVDDIPLFAGWVNARSFGPQISFGPDGSLYLNLIEPSTGPFWLRSDESPSFLETSHWVTHVPDTSELSWRHPLGAYRFDVQVATDPEFSSLVFAENVPQAQVQFVAPTPGETYYWRVRSIHADGPHKWSEVSSFRTAFQGPCERWRYALTSQAQVDAFPSDCSWITDRLTIGPSSDIHDLSPLANLRDIRSQLRIAGNESLVNIDALSGLTRLGYFEIYGNPLLENLNGLSGITSLDEYSECSHCATVSVIAGNASLTNLDGLSGLVTVKAALSIVGNDALSSLDGLSNLTEVGLAFTPHTGLEIVRNPLLTNLDGLSRLTSVDGNLTIEGNDSLTDLGGLSNLQRAWRLQVRNNASLTSLHGLLNAGFGAIEITRNPSLVNLDGLGKLTRVHWLTIEDNRNLENIDALSGIESPGEVFILEVRGNGRLANCGEGLYRLVTSGVVLGSVDMHGNAPDGDCNNNGADLLKPFDVQNDRPELLSPRNDSVLHSGKVELHWRRLIGVDRYNVQIASDASFAPLVFGENLPDPPLVFEPPGVPGTYFWRVQAVASGTASQWSKPWSFMTAPQAPGEVTLIEPDDGAKGISTTPVFRWVGPDSALTYQLHVACDSAFSDVVVNDSSLFEAHDSLTVALEHVTDYYWRVRARNAGGDGPWSDVWSFRTAVAAPDAVVLGAPEDGATGVPPFANLTWQTIDDVIQYHLQLSADAAFATPIVDDSTLTDPSRMAVDPLAYSTTFFWHVRAARDDRLGKSAGVIYGPWSETRSFTVAIGTVTESDASLPTEFALHQNYPNPFNPSTTIQYDLPKAAFVRLTVFDALGRFVESLVSGHLSAGRYQVVWEADRSPSGIYFVRMETGSFSRSQRVLLLK